MNIIMLGSGNVATHLGKSFFGLGHIVLQVWSRNLANAQSLASILNAEAIDQFSQLDATADLYVISVVDDGILHILKNLPSISAIIVHTSGSTPMDIIGPYAKAYGVFYPLQTFSKDIPLSLKDTPILIEGSDDASLTVLKELAFSISSKVQVCTSTQRVTLHVAAVFACNFTNHLYAIAQQLLTENDLDFELIRPLILETAQKVQGNLPTEVQTGPAVREDQLTLDRHLEHLEKYPDLLRIYMLLSKDIIKIKNKSVI